MDRQTDKPTAYRVAQHKTKIAQQKKCNLGEKMQIVHKKT